jgi:hypothetical protein
MRHCAMKSCSLILVFIVAVLILTASAARAQKSEQTSGELGEAAVKIDEFGMVRGCDHSAHLDNFAIELQNRPDTIAFIIAYGPDGKGSGTGDFRLRITKDYFVQSRGIEEERIKTLYGGRYREMRESFVEFWLVPPGAPEPKPVRYKNDARSFTGKFAEYEAYDYFGWDEGTGPSVGDSTLAGFADVLTLQPKTLAYVVAYNGEEAAPGAWRRVAESDADDLRERYGIDAARVKVLFGGYMKETKVRLWVTPPDAPPPVKGDKKERRPETAAQIGTYDRYYLKYEENERRVFRGFAEVLKADEQLNVCFVVRPEPASAEEFDPDIPRDPEEPPDIDFLQLVDKWKARLSKEYGIGEHRIVILVAPQADDSGVGQLETWVVPPGAALPDTSSVVEDAEQTEEVDPKE